MEPPAVVSAEPSRDVRMIPPTAAMKERSRRLDANAIDVEVRYARPARYRRPPAGSQAHAVGALVITSIDNGLGLLAGSGEKFREKFLITSAVLLAITVDSLSRRAQAQAGRA